MSLSSIPGPSPAEADPEALRQAISSQVYGLKEDMKNALPFKKSGWLRALLRRPPKKQSSAIALSEDPRRVYTRAWLERPITRYQADSPIELRTDKVSATTYSEDYSHQRATGGIVAARLEPGDELKIGGHTLATPPAETEARLIELRGLVATIGQAALEGQLRQAGPAVGGYRFSQS